jgi:hypothetical protein
MYHWKKDSRMVRTRRLDAQSERRLESVEVEKDWIIRWSERLLPDTESERDLAKKKERLKLGTLTAIFVISVEVCLVPISPSIVKSMNNPKLNEGLDVVYPAVDCS